MTVHLVSLNTTLLIPTTATTMTTKCQFTYNIGDRIAERPKPNGPLTKYHDVRQRIAKYRTQRYGHVLGIVEKPNKLGHKQKFLVIQWDHLASPTEHATARICPVSELERLTKEVLVPGE